MSIRRLDQVVADAIAAGEVVERPASVVKELVENSIDAGATQVGIDIEGAGSSLVRVSDDGAGIDAADLPLLFVRHATSKVRSLDDLGRIGSLGFRGEALASIGAVADVTCTTTAADAAVGAGITARHGQVGVVRPAAPVAGTRIEVRGLFENTPARRSFLKKPATETAAILRVVTAIGIANPSVAARLTVDGRLVLELPGDGNPVAAIRAAHPTLGAQSLLRAEGRRGEVSLVGWVAEPALLRRGRDAFYLSVNHRPVFSRSLAFAAEQAYRGLVEPGMHPIGCIDVEVPADRVDVNVHPTKREVRFRDERAVFGLVQEACIRALQASEAYRGGGLFSTAEPAPAAAPSVGRPPTGFAVRDSPGRQTAYVAGEAGIALADGNALVSSLGGYSGPALGIAPVGAIIRGPFHLIGQLMECYILAEGPAGLVIVDQHAAHERVIFNRLRAAADGERPWQPLLVPFLLRLSAVQEACLRDNIDDLRAAGLEVEEFGRGAARLTAVDAQLPQRGLERLVMDVLDDLVAEGRELDLSRRLERATYTVACHSAVRFNQRLSRDEMEHLLRDLEVADPGITCPHGRPTILEIGSAQLRREFKRS